MKYCPYCESLLTSDMTVFTRNNEIIGCENCIDDDFADEYYSDEELEEMYEEELAQSRHDDYLYESYTEDRLMKEWEAQHDQRNR